MSEAIKIKEGGVDRSQNQISKLKTNMQGGGVCYWVPETERETDSKSITANGIYTAEDEGLYGYDEINVSVQGTGGVSGRDNPGGGTEWDEYNVNVDDDGYIVETKIPSAIQIEIPPLKNSYVEGERIDLTGAVVKLLDANGNLFTDEAHPDGIIPLSELMADPATAQASGDEKEYTDGDGLNVVLVSFTTPTHYAARFCGDTVLGFAQISTPYNCTIGGNGDRSQYGTQVYVTKYGGKIYYYGLELFEQDYVPVNLYDIDSGVLTGGSSTQITQSNWIGGSPSWYEYFGYVPVSTKNPADADMGRLHPTGATVEIQWMRPADGAILSDTFDIFIESSEGGNASGNEGSGGFEGGGAEHGF